MSQGNYILVNGSFLPAADYRISLHESDDFLFSEKIRAVRSAFPFFAESLKMIKFHFMLFDQTFHELTENEGAELKRQMERTLTKNKQFLGSLLTIRFWVSEQKVSYSIQSEKLVCRSISGDKKSSWIAFKFRDWIRIILETCRNTSKKLIIRSVFDIKQQRSGC